MMWKTQTIEVGNTHRILVEAGVKSTIVVTLFDSLFGYSLKLSRQEARQIAAAITSALNELERPVNNDVQTDEG